METVIITIVTVLGMIAGAHSLCGKIHGHNYILEVSIEGEIKENGMIIDFKKLKEIVDDRIIKKIDHQFLNNIFTFPPTCENLAVWDWEELRKDSVKAI